MAFADQFGAVGEQARDDVVEVIDGEHDTADRPLPRRRTAYTPGDFTYAELEADDYGDRDPRAVTAPLLSVR